jgi:hypothetical protein
VVRSSPAVRDVSSSEFGVPIRSSFPQKKIHHLFMSAIASSLKFFAMVLFLLYSHQRQVLFMARSTYLLQELASLFPQAIEHAFFGPSCEPVVFVIKRETKRQRLNANLPTD